MLPSTDSSPAPIASCIMFSSAGPIRLPLATSANVLPSFAACAASLGSAGIRTSILCDGLFEILAAYFQCVRVNAIVNDEDLASRRIGTQPEQDANRVAGRRTRHFSDKTGRASSRERVCQ